MHCPQCQHENPDRAKFCLECGHPAGTQPPAPATQPTSRFSSPQTYTPQHLAERIINSRGTLEGERKQVTVLFADLKGSMELLADRDPEEARRILDPVLERMMDAVHRYEGTVNQVMGDGIMALFGAPLAHEDHAVRACYAALRMQETVKQYADEVRRTQGITPQIRVGLNSGEVVVRSIGSDLRMDYTAVGQTTHLAARMEQLATPGSILLAPDALRLAEGYVQVQALGSMQVKGLSEPVEIYELLGAGMARSRLQAAAARGLTKFVGRDAELQTLRRTLEQGGAGHGQIVALVGEPGVGKSRLVWEFSHSHRTQGWLVLEGGSVSYGKAASYLPVIDLLQGYCGIEDRDDVRHIREKLTGKVLTLDPALQPLLPPLLALLDVPVDDAQWQTLDPPQRRQRTLAALKRLILRESQEQPLLVVFEDLHWIDAETQALLDSLVDSLPTARALLLVTYRPEYEHTWHHKTYYQQLRLDPLPPESADELIAALLGAASELQPLKRAVIEHTEGNPFFVEESIRTLVESGVLTGGRGSYRLAKPFERAQAPATVQAVLAARIDRLSPGDKRLLQSAAIVGKDIPFRLLHAVAELPDDQLHQGLARLQGAEFLYEATLFPELEYTFKHALTHEVAYGSVLQERRRALHAQIVHAIERLYGERLAEQVERLADHALRGEVWEKAAGYLWQAGAKAALRSANREAVAYLEQALSALRRLPESRETLEQTIDVRLDLRNVLLPVGAQGQILEHLREAETLAKTLNDQTRLGRISSFMTNYFWMTGDPDRAVESGHRALAIAATLQDVALQVDGNYYLSLAYLARGDYGEALQHLRRNVALLEGERLHERFGLPGLPAVFCRSWLAACLSERGEFAEGIASGEEGIRIAEALDHPFSLCAAYELVGYLYLRQGDFERARSLLERALGLCQTQNIPILYPQSAGPLGYTYALCGRVADALPLLQQAVEHSASVKFTSLHSLLVAWLSEAYLLAGHGEDASQHASRALDLAREHKERGHEAWALRLLGEVAAHGNPPDVEQAEGYYRQALVVAEDLGMRPLVAHCYLGLGVLYQHVGRDEQARIELATAAELYRAMEMAFCLGKAETVLAQVAG